MKLPTHAGNFHQTSYTCGSDFHPHVKTNISYLHESMFSAKAVITVADVQG